MRRKKMPAIICKACLQEVSLQSSDGEYCLTCAAILDYERRKAVESLKPSDVAKSPIQAILIEIENYNKANNKNLSYGKYTSLKERGLI